MATLWYILVIFATALGLAGDQLENSHLATADAVFNMFNLTSCGEHPDRWRPGRDPDNLELLLIGASRMIYALSRTGMLPAWLSSCTLHIRPG